MDAAPGKASAKWLAEGAGSHYRAARFATPRAALRDVRAVQHLFDLALGNLEGPRASRAAARSGAGRVARLLDVPCGSGRLATVLSARAERYVGLDASRSMLAAAHRPLAASGLHAVLLEGDGLCLPFRDASFDAVVACRFLHHLRDERELAAALAELVRVSRGVVIASFWDECSLPAWRRQLGLKRDEGPAGRSGTRRARLASLLDRAGADVVAWRATFRFVSQQSFFAARVRRGGS